MREALKLFDADATRQSYTPGSRNFIVSPWNSRERLSAFIRGAERELLVYDPRLTDRVMRQLLAKRVTDGVDVKVIGKHRHQLADGLNVEKYQGWRLHVRAIVRDGTHAFVGSQSLGKIAFDDRREVGVIVSDPRGPAIRSAFQRDWKLAALMPAQPHHRDADATGRGHRRGQIAAATPDRDRPAATTPIAAPDATSLGVPLCVDARRRHGSRRHKQVLPLSPEMPLRTVADANVTEVCRRERESSAGRLRLTDTFSGRQGWETAP